MMHQQDEPELTPNVQDKIKTELETHKNYNQCSLNCIKILSIGTELLDKHSSQLVF